MTTVLVGIAANTASYSFGPPDSAVSTPPILPHRDLRVLALSDNQPFSSHGIQAMFSFGEFFSLDSERGNYSVWELSLFIIIG